MAKDRGKGMPRRDDAGGDDVEKNRALLDRLYGDVVTNHGIARAMGTLAHVILHMDHPLSRAVCRALKTPEGPRGSSRAFVVDADVWAQALCSLPSGAVPRTQFKHPVPAGQIEVTVVANRLISTFYLSKPALGDPANN